MKYLDLSHLVDKDTPVYPGDSKVKIEPSAQFEKDGYEGHSLSISTHVGTHIDAPSHMVAGGKKLNGFTIDKFIGNGVCIKIEDKISLENVKNNNIGEDDIVLFNTGMSKFFHDPRYFKDYPGVPEDVANYLVEHRVKMVGVDTCSIDHEPFLTHKILLGNNILLIENLTNLEQLVDKKFKIYAFPLNLQLDGSPARVVAEFF